MTRMSIELWPGRRNWFSFERQPSMAVRIGDAGALDRDAEVGRAAPVDRDPDLGLDILVAVADAGRAGHRLHRLLDLGGELVDDFGIVALDQRLDRLAAEAAEAEGVGPPDLDLGRGRAPTADGPQLVADAPPTSGDARAARPAAP